MRLPRASATREACMSATDAVSSIATACAHCGLPVAICDRNVIDDKPSFCCAGCHAAWSILPELGLSGYYRLAGRRGAAVASSGHSFEELDHPSFHAHYVARAADGLANTEL